MTNNNFQTIKSQIIKKWSCLSYARDILGLPVSHDGDRCTSLAPGPHTHSNAFQVFNDYWHDYTWDKHGDVIDLCAWAKHNGNIGEALRELGPEFLTQKPESYVKIQNAFAAQIDKWHNALRQEDRDYLHSRRITDETIDKLKIGYNETTQRIIFPYWQNGSPVYFSARDATGRWKTDPKNCPKYKKRFTSDYIENTIWGMDSLNPDFCGDVEHDEKAAFRDKFLLVLEGQVDALSAYQDKWHVISPVCGAFGNKLMPRVRDIAKNFECVVVIFDNDTSGDKFRLAMAKFLFSNNIPFVCGHTQHPDIPGAKFDVSDYYTSGRDIADLVRNAADGITELASSFRPGDEKEFEQFMMTAGKFVTPPALKLLMHHVQLDKGYAAECIKQAKRGPRERELADKLLEAHKLCYVPGDSFYEYEHGVWNAKHDMFIQRYTRDLIGINASVGQMSSVAKHAAIVTSTDKQFNGDFVVNLANGILSLPTKHDPCAGWSDVKLLEHSPEYMTTIQLKIAFDRSAACPKWEKFIAEIMQDDKEKMRYLRQVLGYSAFYPGNPEQTGFMFMGDGANGKSVLIEVIRAVLDPRNCSDVELSNMADRFEPYALRHSLINFCTETNVNVKGAESAIKKVVACDPIRASKKGVDAVAFKPRCKLICACNSYINSKDLTYAFLRRWRFIPFNRTFTPEEANRNLVNELKEELPGILNWLIEGYLDYIQNGLIEIEEDTRTKEEFVLQYNPIATFLKYGINDMAGKCLTTTELYNGFYVPWSEKSHSGIVQFSNFSRLLPKMMENICPEVKCAMIHGYRAYKFPDDMPDQPTAAKIFELAEQEQAAKAESQTPAKTGETADDVVQAPAMTHTPNDPEMLPLGMDEWPEGVKPLKVKMPVMGVNDKIPARAVLDAIEQYPIRPDITGLNGSCKVPPNTTVGYVSNYRAFLLKWEKLMRALRNAGLPHELWHAVMYHACAKNYTSEIWGTEDYSAQIVEWVLGNLVEKQKK